MQFLASLCLPGLGFEMVKGAKHATDFSGHVNLAATIRTNLGLKQFRHPPNYLDCLEFGGACSYKVYVVLLFLVAPKLGLELLKTITIKGPDSGVSQNKQICFSLNS